MKPDNENVKRYFLLFCGVGIQFGVVFLLFVSALGLDPGKFSLI